MKALFIFLLIVAFFVVSLFIWNTIQRKKGNTVIDDKKDEEDNAECCGQHAICEKDSLINTFVEETEYFDDEELDEYIGIASDEYSDEVANQFREILYSMYDEDKPQWVRSLQKRGISIPNQIKDEIILIVNDLRSSH